MATRSNDPTPAQAALLQAIQKFAELAVSSAGDAQKYNASTALMLAQAYEAITFPRAK